LLLRLRGRISLRNLKTTPLRDPSFHGTSFVYSFPW
jgi:hypothetical protein